MVQDIFDKSQIVKELIINPKVKNKVLYTVSNAITDNQKTQVRKLKAKIKKGTNGTIIPPEVNTFSTDRLSSDDLERRLISALNNQPNNANLLGKAIDFFIKVKAKTDTLEDEINMEALRDIGIIAKSGD